MTKKQAIIIGAGPAGLTAAYELLEKTDIIPVIYEAGGSIGGISRTVDYNGNKIDIGGHRFFSKSKKVVDWWKKILPVQTHPAKDDIILNRPFVINGDIQPEEADPEKSDKVMLFRGRISRIFFMGSFFDYPVSLNLNTLSNLGIDKAFKMGFSYLKTKLMPVKKQENLEEFFISRFGKELYETFFKDYTEKVWGVSCRSINAEWGEQRIKGLSVSKAVMHFVKKALNAKAFLDQSSTETSLIEQFMYPKYGPGQLWEEVAGKILEKGGKIYLKHEVVGIKAQHNRILEVIAENKDSNTRFSSSADFYFSSMPVRDLIRCLNREVPDNVKDVSEGLLYRDFITVGLLLNKINLQNTTSIKTVNNIIPDNWIYVQETSVKMGRIQVFNNWSPYMVNDLSKIWLGLEYFCNEGDELWGKNDEEFKKFAVDELVRINFIDRSDVLDSLLIRVKKAYPAYFGTYERFEEVKSFLDGFENLYPVGRNGMHRYNNMDHSMLTAMAAVENILNGRKSKENIWGVNSEKIYHEKK